VRKTIVTVVLLGLLVVLGVSLALGAGKTRAYAARLLERSAAPSASVSASAAPSARAPAAAPSVSSSGAAPEPKLEVDRSLAVIGLGWELMAPGLLGADGLKSTDSSAFGRAGLKVSLSVAGAMPEIERALAKGGGAPSGADLALLPLSELVNAHERLRALDLRVFFVSGWSQGKDTLYGTSLTKLPSAGNLAIEYTGGADPLLLALLALDLTGTALDRAKLEEHVADAVLRAKGGTSIDPAAKQQDVVLGTREASRLLPYVLVAPGPQLDEREQVFADFVQGFLAGTDLLLKDRAKAARTLAAIETAPEALSLLHALADWEPIRLHENTALLGLSGRGALPIEALIDWQLRARRAARIGASLVPEQSLVDPRVVTRLARAQPKLLQPPEVPKRRAATGAPESLLERIFQKDDEEAIVAAIGVLAAVFPRLDVRVTLPSRSAKARVELLDRAALRYDIDRARLLIGTAPPKNGAAALLQVLRAL